MSTFDPDAVQDIIDRITPEQFAVLVAKHIQETPSSQNYALVNQVIEGVTGWDAEHEQVRGLIDRIAGSLDDQGGRE